MRKKKILYNVIRDYDYELFRSVYERLIEDPGLDIYFGSALSRSCRRLRKKQTRFWKRHLLRINNRQPTLNILKHYGIDKKKILTEFQMKWTRIDLSIDTNFIGKIRNKFPLTLKRVQTFHGFSGKKTASGEDATINSAAGEYDALFCFSDWHAELFRKSGFLTDRTRIYTIGFPILDGMIDSKIGRNTVLKQYGADVSKLSVLYAPSWNPQLSLHNIGKNLIEKLVDNSWTLLVKLHPNLMGKQPAVQAGGEIDWRTYLENYERKNKLIVLRDHYSPKYLQAADVLITDYGTTLFEYMLLGRPIIFYDTSEAASVSSLPEKMPQIRRAVHLFSNAEQAIDLLKTGRYKDTEGMSEAKRNLAEERFYDVGGATDRAVKAIYELLEIEPYAK